MLCPNRTRKRRLGHGGGTPGCRGKLAVILTAPVMLPLARWPRGGAGMPPFESALPARARRRGVRIRPSELALAYQGADIVCQSCQWSLRKLLAGLKTRRKRTI
jgi:hypothetical protein